MDKAVTRNYKALKNTSCDISQQMQRHSFIGEIIRVES